MTYTLTHRGWFGLCPVYFGDLNSEAPMVVPRHALFEPLMSLSEILYDVAAYCCQVINPQFEPQWPLRVTGQLDEPKTWTV